MSQRRTVRSNGTASETGSLFGRSARIWNYGRHHLRRCNGQGSWISSKFLNGLFYLLLCLGVLLLNTIILPQELLRSLPLLPLQREGCSLALQLGPPLLRSLLQAHKIVLILLRELLLLCFHLRIQHEIELMLLLIGQRMQVVRFLLVTCTQRICTISQLRLYCLRMTRLLFLDGFRIRKISGETSSL